MHILDTNVVIHLRDGAETTTRHVAGLGQPLAISVVTLILLEGREADLAPDLSARRARMDAILESVSTLPFDDVCADRYAIIMAATGFSRALIMERMIAAQALLHDATLVTMNGDDFKDIPGLKLLIW